MKHIILLSALIFNLVDACEEMHALWNLTAAFNTIHDEVKSNTKTTLATQKINTRHSDLSIIMQPSIEAQDKKESAAKDKPTPMSIYHNN